MPVLEAELAAAEDVLRIVYTAGLWGGQVILDQPT